MEQSNTQIHITEYLSTFDELRRKYPDIIELNSLENLTLEELRLKYHIIMNIINDRKKEERVYLQLKFNMLHSVYPDLDIPYKDLTLDELRLKYHNTIETLNNKNIDDNRKTILFVKLLFIEWILIDLFKNQHPECLGITKNAMESSFTSIQLYVLIDDLEETYQPIAKFRDNVETNPNFKEIGEDIELKNAVDIDALIYHIFASDNFSTKYKFIFDLFSPLQNSKEFFGKSCNLI